MCSLRAASDCDVFSLWLRDGIAKTSWEPCGCWQRQPDTACHRLVTNDKLKQVGHGKSHVMLWFPHLSCKLPTPENRCTATSSEWHETRQNIRLRLATTLLIPVYTSSLWKHVQKLCKYLTPTRNSMPRAFLSTYSKIQHSKIDALQSGGAAQNSSNRTRRSLSRKYAQTEGLFWNTNNASKCTSDRDAAEVCVLNGNELPHEHYLFKISSTTFKLQAHFPPA